ncbi:hypothetical protein E2C01_094354 [Portunus trituberculatus]|uniref:Uncharacterized protein n=1 Tax=Portunus trituberculatus TaxID=210409 RepID=A0A5B7JWY0_PORTR|nr:hypothetical protein [Portunus trituberculatus]
MFDFLTNGLHTVLIVTPVTLGSGLNDLLNSTATSDPLYASQRPPLVFTCHNKTHHLHLKAVNTSFFITKIIRRSAAESLAGGIARDCHCNLAS